MDGLSWRFFAEESRWIEVDVTGYEHPCILVAPSERGRLLTCRIYGIRDGKLEHEAHIKRIDHTIFALDGKYSKYDRIAIHAGSDNIHAGSDEFSVWLAEEKTIHRLWDEYLDAEYRFYTEIGIPLMDRYGLSGKERFDDLRACRGRAFPTTPQEAASIYANACTTGLRGQATERLERTETWSDAEAVRRLYHLDCKLAEHAADVRQLNAKDIAAALADMDKKFPQKQFLEHYQDSVAQLDNRKAIVLEKIATGTDDAKSAAEWLLADSREMMLANPLLDGMELLAIRRGIGTLDLRDHAARLSYPGRILPFRSEGSGLGAPSLSTHSILRTLQESKNNRWNCDIVKLSDLQGEVKITPLYVAPNGEFLVSNAHVHWDGDRVAFTMGSRDEEMALFELNIASREIEQLSPEGRDHFIDSCYLPDGNIVVMSTAIMTGLPCEGGSHILSNMYLLDPETGKIRQLGVDQENSYHATVQDNGRVMYVRYEYTDAPHYFSRIVMDMNPDGTDQRAKYGSNSYWPTSIFYPKQVPGNANLFSAVVSGHHGASHMGRLVLFDVGRGRHEADGAVQFIGARDEPVSAIVVDRIYNANYPKFMYPTPLDAEYYLTMMKPGEYDAWGLYLVDRFDNKTRIYEPEEDFIAWPQILDNQPSPPVLPSRIQEDSKTSTLYVQDIYQVSGLEGIRRGVVKELAIFAYHYGYKAPRAMAISAFKGRGTPDTCWEPYRSMRTARCLSTFRR